MAIVNKKEFTFAEFAHEMEQADEAVATLPVASDRQEAIRDIVYADVNQHFDDDASAWGDAWAPHAPATVKRHGPHPLLELTGRMREAATTQGAPGNWENVSDREIVFGVDMTFVGGFDYAAAQQLGTRTIPAREFFDLSESAVGQIIADASYYFVHEVIGY